MPRGAIVLFDQREGRELIERLCRANRIPCAVLEQLLEEIIDNDARQRRRGLWQAFDSLLDSLPEHMGTEDVPPSDRTA